MIGVTKSIVQITMTGMEMELVTVVTTVHWYLAYVLHVINCIRLIVMVMDYQMNAITAPIITTQSSQLTVMVSYLVRGNKVMPRKHTILTNYAEVSGYGNDTKGLTAQIKS